ncbi:class I SAM-dependent methyltransferase [Pectobacterium cacticida]|uniref:Class I SAM-dependent methyltransferase n=1 Tax=Pectobacterium cacticida TaxID=69221 RepID=A0ABZ2G5W2_9GAMM|nr:class I SAM-dependent methyltransferase [Pectobacterium cacticida]UYX05472.1 class I SAM-dependent methyltransferase [Pectobacterium cacticida]
MQCPVCDSKMFFYFLKKFSVKNIENAEYLKCPVCQVVVSKTHFEMTSTEWEELNEKIHSGYQGLDSSEDDPKWLMRLDAQSKAISQLYNDGILERDHINAIDYGCGDGKLVKLLESDNIRVGMYDKYMTTAMLERDNSLAYLRNEDVEGKIFDLVITCSVLEHLRCIDDVNAIFDLVDKRKGMFAFHTLICEDVPQDPEWFYLSPVHCLFFTNKSMSILFDRFEFKGCLYNVEAQMWFFIYNESMLERFKKSALGNESQWLFSDTFIDYWKVKPYRKQF